MMEQAPKKIKFFITSPSPCPYLAGQFERKVFIYLNGADTDGMNAILTHGGFRRSQNIVYRPVCEACQACVSVRILAGEFSPDSSMRRICRNNADITAEMVTLKATAEQYRLFHSYQNYRHADGEMARMTMSDYSAMLADSPVGTYLIEYRLGSTASEKTSETARRQLLGVALTDTLSDGLSMVYSFYDPHQDKRSLGTFMILDHIRRARENALPHVYLGYWIAGSRKMQYKIRFKPQEHMGGDGWFLYT